MNQVAELLPEMANLHSLLKNLFGGYLKYQTLMDQEDNKPVVNYWVGDQDMWMNLGTAHSNRAGTTFSLTLRNGVLLDEIRQRNNNSNRFLPVIACHTLVAVMKKFEGSIEDFILEEYLLQNFPYDQISQIASFVDKYTDTEYRLGERMKFAAAGLTPKEAEYWVNAPKEWLVKTKETYIV